MNFYDILLAKKLSGGGGGDITTEALNVTANGQYTAPQGKAYTPVNVNVAGYKVGEVETPTPIATFNGTSNPLKSLTASIVPVQDLHGYDSPWAGGAGKNKLPLVLSDLKTANTSGTWRGNAYTLNGVTFEVLTDIADNVEGIKVNGTAMANVYFDLVKTFNSTEYAGMIANFSGAMSGIWIRISASDRIALQEIFGVDTVISDNGDNLKLAIRVGNNESPNTTICPMIRLSTVTDATFAPYSNICPISGWTEEVITRCGKNLFDKDNFKFSANGYIDGNSGHWTGSKTIKEYPTDTLSNYWNSPLIDVTPLKGKTITYNGFKSASGVARGLVDENFNVLTLLGTSSVARRTVDLSQYPTAKYLVLSFVKNDYSLDNAQLEIGTSASQYEPYAGTTTTIPFTDGQGQSVEVFGGEIDVINGVVTPCPYYASYNGEQLIGEWISDRDVYSPNTTPTTGAQVVNIGATGTPFSVQPTSIKTLDGDNNVFASTGQIEDLEYFEKL